MPRFVITVLLSFGAATPLCAQSYDQAKAWYDQGRIAEARTGFAALEADTRNSADTRVKALIGQARIAWLVDDDREQSLSRLRRALALRPDDCPAHLLALRILRAEQQNVQGAEWVTPTRCADPGMYDSILVEKASAELALAPKDSRAEKDHVDRAADLLAAVSPIGSLGLQANALKIEIALLRGDVARALSAWQGYYWLRGSSGPQAFEREDVRSLIAAGAPTGAPARAQTALLDLLVRAGFEPAARAFAVNRDLGRRASSDPLFRKAQLYFTMRSSLRTMLLDLNRRLARSEKEKGALEKEAGQLGEALSDLYGRLSAALEPVVAKPPGVGTIKHVTDAYNLGGTFGFTGGWPSVHAGHYTENRVRSVTQFGKSTEVRFSVLDNMLANGFEAWLWDGEKQAGGWGGGTAIVQVRSPYARSTIRATQLAMDPEAQRKLRSEAETHASQDQVSLAAAKASGRKVAFLPGLAKRLELQRLKQIIADVTTGDADTFAERFAARERDLTVEHSIWIHEGRHALDATHYKALKLTPGDLEYRAKLAEIMLARFPRMAFHTINDELVGGDSGHGIANTRILEAYGAWIDRHKHAIAGYDEASPGLPQLYKLTDEQLRSVARNIADFDS